MLHTDMPQLIQQLCSRRSSITKILRKSKSARIWWTKAFGELNTYTQWSPVEIRTPTQWHLISCNVTPAACVIIQHYSSASLISLFFHDHTKNWAHFIKVVFLHFKNCINLLLHKSRSVYKAITNQLVRVTFLKMPQLATLQLTKQGPHGWMGVRETAATVGMHRISCLFLYWTKKIHKKTSVEACCLKAVKKTRILM